MNSTQEASAMAQWHRFLLIGSILAMLVFVNAHAASRLTSRALDSTIEVDGWLDDWDGLPTVALEDSLHSLSLAHDAHNLFVAYRFADDRLARRLLERGVILWFNGDGKTKHTDERFGVRYGGSEEIAAHLEAIRALGPEPEVGGPGRRGRRPRRLGPSPGRLTVIRSGVKETAPEGLPNGPEAASSLQDGVFCYELRIPLEEIGGKITGQPSSKRRKLAVGIQIGGTTEAERESIEAAIQDALGRGGGPAGVSGGGGGRGGGMGGMGGVGGGRGRSPGEGAGRSEMRDRLNPKIEWLIVELVLVSR